MKNREWIIYTLRHRRAFEYCVRHLVTEPVLREEMLRRARIHDMDKVIMYLFMEQQEAQKIHMSTRAHHLENSILKSHGDLVEAVIDYECAPYTKPDKPMNAYELIEMVRKMNLLSQEMLERLTGVMKELGICRPGTFAEDKEGQAYIAGLGEITDEMIREEILTYLGEIH